MKKKKFLVIVIIIVLYILFLVYSNINLGKKRETVFFTSLDVAGDRVVVNKTIIKEATPLFYERGEKAVLLLHGYGGTPYELSELAEFLSANNLTVYVPLFPHHGVSVEELSKLKWDDAYIFVNESYSLLKEKYDKVYVGGLCNGGLFSLELARNNEVEAIFTMSTPIVISNRFVDKLPLKVLFRVLRIFTPNVRRIERGIAKNPAVAEKLPSFDRFPVNSLITLADMTSHLKKHLNEVDEPILILQSTWDNRASPYSAEYLYNNIASKEKKIVYLNNSGHVITIDHDKEKVFSEILNFINEN